MLLHQADKLLIGPLTTPNSSRRLKLPTMARTLPSYSS